MSTTTDCETCSQPGDWCGYGGTGPNRPCVCCGEPTVVRSACGAARTAMCTGKRATASSSVAPVTFAAPAPVAPQQAPRAPRTTRAAGRAADQQAATNAAIAGMATRQPLRLLTALEDTFAPLRTGDDGRRSRPYWRPELPGMTYSAHVVTGYSWKRPYLGEVTVLDRSGAWVSAASSSVVAHGALSHTGPCEFDGRPGYYLLTVYPWPESDVMPSPIGRVRSETVWLPAPTVTLLRDLVAQGRWPDVAVLDSYTGDGVRVTEWTKHVNALRAHAINTYGRDSDQYEDVKVAFGESMSLMIGQVTDGVRRTWKSRAARPDWTHTFQSQASSTLWRWGDESRQVVPELAPVALRNVDELVVPREAVAVLTTTLRPGGRKPLKIDPSGIALGTFKVKGTEEWAA